MQYKLPKYMRVQLLIQVRDNLKIWVDSLEFGYLLWLNREFTLFRTL